MIFGTFPWLSGFFIFPLSRRYIPGACLRRQLARFYSCVRLLAIRVGKTSGASMPAARMAIYQAGRARNQPSRSHEFAFAAAAPRRRQPLLLFSRKGKVVQPANYSKRQQQVSLSVGGEREYFLQLPRAWKKIRRLTHSCRAPAMKVDYCCFFTFALKIIIVINYARLNLVLT